MLRLFRALPIALLPGCLVSFNDYPLGDIEARGGDGGIATGGAAPIGGKDTLPSAGSLNEGGEGLTAKPGSMLDDFEDGDAAILQTEGRHGNWYVGNDGQGMQTPGIYDPMLPSKLEPARGSSTGALHTFGGPFAVWGALVGTSLTDGEYNLGKYQGIRFWVRKGPLPGAMDKVRLNFPMPGTNAGPGATCNPCTDHFGVDVPLSAEWTQVDVKLSQLKQTGWGVPQLPAPDLAHVTSLQIGFPKGAPFDLWLDDVELY